MKKLLLPVITAGIFLFSGCASTEVGKAEDVKQERIYQNLKVRIDKTTNKAYASATFRFGGALGTTLIVDGTGDITFNGESMKGKKNLFLGHVYRTDKIEREDCAYVFEYTNADKKTFKNSVILNPIDFDPSTMAEIDNTKKNKVEWAGASIGTDEKVEIVIRAKVGDSRRSFRFENRSKNDRRVVIRRDQVSQLPVGPATIQVVRHKKPSIQQASEQGGSISGEYKSKKYPIMIVGETPEPTPTETTTEEEPI